MSLKRYSLSLSVFPGHLAPLERILLRQMGHDFLDLLPLARVAGPGTETFENVRRHPWGENSVRHETSNRGETFCLLLISSPFSSQGPSFSTQSICFCMYSLSCRCWSATRLSALHLMLLPILLSLLPIWAKTEPGRGRGRGLGRGCGLGG